MPSYSPVFSQPFIEYIESEPNTEFAVPDGYTAVVRQISGYQDVGGWILYLYLRNSPSADAIVATQLAQVGDFNYAATEGRWVVPGGGIIQISISSLGSGPSFYVGGYLLRNTLS